MVAPVVPPYVGWAKARQRRAHASPNRRLPGTVIAWARRWRAFCPPYDDLSLRRRDPARHHLGAEVNLLALDRDHGHRLGRHAGAGGVGGPARDAGIDADRADGVADRVSVVEARPVCSICDDAD